MDVTYIEECESTQDLAWAAPPPTSPHGSFFIAARQSLGRGRRAGRSWSSPPGGLYLSWRLNLEDPSGFSLLGGLAVLRSLQPWIGKPWLKWPNDCWVGAAKIAGVLPDCRWRGAHCQGLVLGIGVNVCVDPALLPQQAVSLHQLCATPPGLTEFTTLLQTQLVQLLELHRAQGLAGYLDEVRKHALPAGALIRYWLGDDVHEGVVAGLDEQGFLLLQSGQRLTTVDRLTLVI